MRLNYVPAVIFVVSGLLSCDDRTDENYAPDPVYSEVIGVSDITSNNATFTLKLKFPVSKTTSGDYQFDDKYIFEYGFLYTSNADQHIRFWNLADKQVDNESGTYHLRVSDLSPSTKYYVKSWVLAGKEKMQQIPWNVSEKNFEFETAQ